MTALMTAALGLLMVATAFLSGLFGMAGGLILIGVLLTILPLPSAMVLHAVTQMASNGWRAFLWRSHIRWRPVAVAASMLGTTLARRILEAMSDVQFRTWANRLITTIACYYIGYGSWLLLSPHFIRT